MADNYLNFEPLYTFLGEQNYDPTIRNFFIYTFTDLLYYYGEHRVSNPEIMDEDSFLKQYINILKKFGKINFIRDINENTDFLKYIVSLTGDKKEEVKIGYIKDENGHYVVTKNNPQYYCRLDGFVSHDRENLNILFDETRTNDMSELSRTFIHELTHIYCTGFKAPAFIMNRLEFMHILNEGYADKQNIYLSSPKEKSLKLPFKLNHKTNTFEADHSHSSYGSGHQIPYQVYYYLFNKFEMLLGNKFIDEWAKAGDDDSYFFKAREIINNKYGRNVFDKIYEDFQIILLSTLNYQNKDLQTLANTNNGILISCKIGETLPQENLIERKNEISMILQDDNLFAANYLKVKTEQEEAMGGLTDDLTKLVKGHYTQSMHRQLLEAECESLNQQERMQKYNEKKKINAKILAMNISACQRLTINQDAFTAAIIDLEKIMINCLTMEINKEGKENYPCSKEYSNYIKQVSAQIATFVETERKPEFKLMKKIMSGSVINGLKPQEEIMEAIPSK